MGHSGGEKIPKKNQEKIWYILFYYLYLQIILHHVNERKNHIYG